VECVNGEEQRKASLNGVVLAALAAARKIRKESQPCNDCPDGIKVNLVILGGQKVFTRDSLFEDIKGIDNAKFVRKGSGYTLHFKPIE